VKLVARLLRARMKKAIVTSIEQREVVREFLLGAKAKHGRISRTAAISTEHISKTSIDKQQ